ncbi:hypothetical protein LIER_33432 [Lithospermum erythrorhizon]|uniref:Uncharacterized protein n=1 Tax=Lithospermum erythrorhizon TaxID=34254 RepID=A0AAV3RXM8_LITER
MDIYAQMQSLSNKLNELCELQNNRSRGGYPNGGQYNNGKAELEEGVEPIVDIEVHGGELQVDVEEPPPYVPPIFVSEEA